MTIPLHRINDEVFIASDKIVRFDAGAIEFIREHAIRTPRGRARICAHKTSMDTLHEMLIAMTPASYIRPHRHLGKVESFHLIDGAVDIAILGDGGELEDVIELAPGRNFYYRLELPRFHTLLINSPVLVIHETTNGPFDPAQSDVAAFSPSEGNTDAIVRYMDQLRMRVEAWKNERIATKDR